MLCDFEIIQLSDGRFHHRCKACGAERILPTSGLHRMCDIQSDAAPVAPSAINEAAASLGITPADIVHYTAALAKWIFHGCPRRSQPEVDRILREYCNPLDKPCEKYVNGRCAQCRCRVNQAMALVNKAAMATEHCPQKKW